MRRATAWAGAATTVVASALVLAPAAQAAERFQVELVDRQVFDADTGTFTSNIPGCTTGESFTLRGMVADRAGVFRGTREFVCDSGVGSVTVNLSARFGEGGSVGTWSIVAATGDRPERTAPGSCPGRRSRAGSATPTPERSPSPGDRAPGHRRTLTTSHDLLVSRKSSSGSIAPR